MIIDSSMDGAIVTDTNNYEPSDYDNFLNSTLKEETSENTIMILLCGLIFGVSCLSACCKYVPNVKQNVRTYINRNSLNNYINQTQLEEQENTNNADICPICIDPFVPRQLSLTLHCNHKFHTTCILDWLNQELSCPMCRTPIQLN